jgi:hypothetical protein
MAMAENNIMNGVINGYQINHHQWQRKVMCHIIFVKTASHAWRRGGAISAKLAALAKAGGVGGRETAKWLKAFNMSAS